MEMPQNIKMLSREEHTAQHKGTLTVERISDEKLNAMINNASYSIDWNKEKNQDTTDHEQQYSILKELKERRETKTTCKKSLPFKEIIKSLESISGTFLVASVKNGEIEGTFCGNESELLSIVNFTFDKLEEVSNGEITKHDLIDALLSAEGED